jgi:putative DNA primase/helicase
MAGLVRHGREQERAFYLESWNGNAPFTIDRIGRGNVHVPHTCLSLFGGIQPSKLRHYIADALRNGPSDDGLMQRLQLIVWPDIPRSGRYVDREPDYGAIERVERIFRQIVQIDAANPLILRFDDDAQELFQEWYVNLDQQLRDSELPLGLESHFSKYRKLMPAIAMLFAVADGSRNCVPLIYAKLACAWCDYLASHARRVYSHEARPEMSGAIALSRRLAKGWKREEGAFTVRDVYRNEWSYLSDPESARSALLMLSQYGWVRREITDSASVGPPRSERPRPKIQRKPSLRISRG